MIISIKNKTDYDIVIERNLLQKADSLIKEIKTDCRICIIADSKSHALYTHNLEENLQNAGYDVHKVVFESGDDSKSVASFQKLSSYLICQNFTKSDLLLSLGGGMISDLVGFTASVYHRGMDYVIFPTTLLCCVDASIGGKTALNLSEVKNSIGSYHNPRGVFHDLTTLETLEKQQILDGLAEIIKAGLILDPSILRLLQDTEKRNLGSILSSLIEKSILVKKNIIGADERETSIRTVLNLGHTVAHAVESLSDYSVSHGRAVALGLLVELTGAVKLGLSSKNMLTDLRKLLEKYEFDLTFDFDPEAVIDKTLTDKKILGNEIVLPIVKTPGDCSLKRVSTGDLSKYISLGIKHYNDC